VNKKDGQLLIRINSAERDQFLQLCETMDTSAARELRKFIRRHFISDCLHFLKCRMVCQCALLQRYCI
jgi:hypothetical protein